MAQCGGIKKYLTPASDSSVYIVDWGVTYKPGDTITLRSNQAFTTVEFHGLTGSPGCPITITNEGGQVLLKGFLKLYGAKYVHIDGYAVPNIEYGIKIQPDRNNILGSFNAGMGVEVTERSKVVEINNVFINHTVFGMSIKQSPACPDSLNYPNWVMDSISIHHNKIQQVNLEGMYIGDTSPDNGPTNPDPRYVIGCRFPTDTIYPRPIRSGHMTIYDNIVDSTGRGGIQLSGHSVSIAEIYNNTVTHSGMNGDQQQGTGISVGMYTHAYIHNNTIRNTLTWGIASLGGSGTGVPLRIENNTIDSSGYLYHYNNLNEQIFPITPSTPVYAPSAIISPTNPDGKQYDFACSMFIKTVTNMDRDSTQFWIKSNRIGKYRAGFIKTFVSDSSSIQIFDYAATHMFQTKGNVVFDNMKLWDGITPTSVYSDYATYSTIMYRSACPCVLNKKTYPTNFSFITDYTL